MKISVLQTLEPDLLDKLATTTNAEVVNFANKTPDVQTLAESEIILGWHPAVVEALNSSHQIKWLQVWSAGVDYLPLDLLAQEQVFLTTASGANSFNIAQQVLGYLLMHVRHLDFSLGKQLQSKWKLPQGQAELTERTIAFIGTGNIAQDTMKLLTPFNMNIIGVNSSGHEVAGFKQCYATSEITEAVKEADFVVSSLPLTTKTKHLVNKTVFAAMKPTALYVAVGRGQTTNQIDLIDALKHGELAAASLDVFEKEPLPSDNELWSMENVVITPHSAGQSNFYNIRVLDSFLANFADYQANGAPSAHIVNYQNEY